jgi:transposase-like protein
MTPGAGEDHEREQRSKRNAAMVKAAQGGATYTEIARRFGLSLSWTGTILRAGGAPVPEHGKGVRLDIDYSIYRDAYASGDTVRDLAREAGVSYGAMYRGLKRAGTTFRPRGGNGRR